MYYSILIAFKYHILSITQVYINIHHYYIYIYTNTTPQGYTYSALHTLLSCPGTSRTQTRTIGTEMSHEPYKQITHIGGEHSSHTYGSRTYLRFHSQLTYQLTNKSSQSYVLKVPNLNSSEGTQDKIVLFL